MWNAIGTSYALTNIQRFWSNFRWNRNNKGLTNWIQSQHTFSELLRTKRKYSGKISWISWFKVLLIFNPNTSSGWQLCLIAFLVVRFLTAASSLLQDPSSFAFVKASSANQEWWGRSVEILEMSWQKAKNYYFYAQSKKVKIHNPFHFL